MSNRQTSAIGAILFLVSGAFWWIATSFEMFRSWVEGLPKMMSDALLHPLLLLLVFGVGLGLAIKALRNAPPTEVRFDKTEGRVARFFATVRRATSLTNIMMIYLPIVLGLAFCVWAYMVSTEVRHLRAQVVRYLLPRGLTQIQINTISDHLSKHEPKPVEVVIKVISGDEEASSFRADLQRTFERAGWGVKFSYDNGVSEGQTINVNQPEPQPGEQQRPLAETLREAFKQADFPFLLSVGSSSGTQITTLSVEVSIGRRRRDKWAVPPPPRGRRELPDDPDK